MNLHDLASRFHEEVPIFVWDLFDTINPEADQRQYQETKGYVFDMWFEGEDLQHMRVFGLWRWKHDSEPWVIMVDDRDYSIDEAYPQPQDYRYLLWSSQMERTTDDAEMWAGKWTEPKKRRPLKMDFEGFLEIYNNRQLQLAEQATFR